MSSWLWRKLRFLALDLPTFAGVPLLLASIAMIAAWLPARHAARVDPAVALRHE